MATPPPYGPYLEEIPVKVYKSKEYPQRARGFSFVVCVCSILLYISVLYIFNLSPSTFLNNNKFWFFVSNALILIIAADYGAFSSSGGNKHDVYEEYVMHSQARSVSSFVSQYPGIATKSISKEEAEDLPEIRKEVVVVQKQKQPENKQEIVIRREPDNPNGNAQEKKIFMESAKKDVDKAGSEKKLIEARTYHRSKSDKPKRVVIDESKSNILRRSDTLKEEDVECSGEENEFSSMSNEELNRRVEEFIQRFNRQIRLQRAGKFHEI